MTAEHTKAKQWRLERGLTLDELAHLSGYSVSSISFFERGISPKGGPVDQYAFHRYKRICHSIDMSQSIDGPSFYNFRNWGQP